MYTLLLVGAIIFDYKKYLQKIKEDHKMTCIIGYVDEKGDVYLGGDSAGVDNNYNLNVRKDTKVFRNGNMIIGYTSSFRMGQLLRFKLKIPKQPKRTSDYRYMCTLFIDAVRKCLKENGYLKRENNKEEIGTFLIGYKKHLYIVDDDLQVGMVKDNYNSCGCGDQYAKGSLATNNNQSSPKQVILTALKVAEKYSGAVRRPFKVIKL